MTPTESFDNQTQIPPERWPRLREGTFVYLSRADDDVPRLYTIHPRRDGNVLARPSGGGEPFQLVPNRARVRVFVAPRAMLKYSWIWWCSSCGRGAYKPYEGLRGRRRAAQEFQKHLKERLPMCVGDGGVASFHNPDVQRLWRIAALKRLRRENGKLVPTSQSSTVPEPSARKVSTA